MLGRVLGRGHLSRACVTERIVAHCTALHRSVGHGRDAARWLQVAPLPPIRSASMLPPLPPIRASPHASEQPGRQEPPRCRPPRISHARGWPDGREWESHLEPSRAVRQCRVGAGGAARARARRCAYRRSAAASSAVVFWQRGSESGAGAARDTRLAGREVPPTVARVRPARRGDVAGQQPIVCPIDPPVPPSGLAGLGFRGRRRFGVRAGSHFGVNTRTVGFRSPSLRRCDLSQCHRSLRKSAARRDATGPPVELDR